MVVWRGVDVTDHGCGGDDWWRTKAVVMVEMVKYTEIYIHTYISWFKQYYISFPLSFSQVWHICVGVRDIQAMLNFSHTCT